MHCLSWTGPHCSVERSHEAVGAGRKLRDEKLGEKSSEIRLHHGWIENVGSLLKIGVIYLFCNVFGPSTQTHAAERLVELSQGTNDHPDPTLPRFIVLTSHKKKKLGGTFVRRMLGSYPN
jgi:hypothetical protein